MQLEINSYSLSMAERPRASSVRSRVCQKSPLLLESGSMVLLPVMPLLRFSISALLPADWVVDSATAVRQVL